MTCPCKARHAVLHIGKKALTSLFAVVDHIQTDVDLFFNDRLRCRNRGVVEIGIVNLFAFESCGL